MTAEKSMCSLPQSAIAESRSSPDAKGGSLAKRIYAQPVATRTNKGSNHMSDCSTAAMLPKGPTKTCGNCGNLLSSPNWWSAACVAIVIQSETFAGYAQVDMENFGSSESCGKWIPRSQGALEKRYQQLEQVVEKLCRLVIEHNGTERGRKCGGIDISRQCDQLEALGVSVDD